MITEFTGLACHSSRPQAGGNAVYAAARFVSWLEQVQNDLASERDIELRHFDTAYSTLNVGTIHGGTGHNLVPHGCWIDWDIREARAGDLNRILDEAGEFTCLCIFPKPSGFTEAPGRIGSWRFSRSTRRHT